jgi:ribose transport system permease protein
MGLALGALCGLFSGFIITKFRITPFIVTLGASQIYTGILNVVTKGRTIQGMPKSFTIIGQGMLGGFIPYPVLFMLILGAILFFVLRYTTFGRYLYAIGGNQTAAKLVGINVNKNRTIVFMLSGVFSAFAGMLIMARLGTAQPTLGTAWLMPAITAPVLGGTSMKGGRGGVIGTIIGALLMTEISNAIVTMRISTYWEQIVIGMVVIIAVLIDSIRMRNSSTMSRI